MSSITPQGYRRTGTGKLEHVAIAESVIGHFLPPHSEIHHFDGNGLNNEHTNLVICENRRYHQLLHARQRIIELGGDPDTHKWCASCLSLQLHTAFFKCRSTFDGLSQRCKSCAKRLGQYYRQKNIEYYREYDKRKYARRKLSCSLPSAEKQSQGL